MYFIGPAGTYTPPDGGEPNHWIVHMNSDALSLGTYSIPAGGTDDQEPHTEDEVYVVQAGRATLVTASGTVPVEPGSVVFVPAGEEHKFTDITKDLAVVVIFGRALRITRAPLRSSGGLANVSAFPPGQMRPMGSRQQNTPCCTASSTGSPAPLFLT